MAGRRCAMNLKSNIEGQDYRVTKCVVGVDMQIDMTTFSD